MTKEIQNKSDRTEKMNVMPKWAQLAPTIILILFCLGLTPATIQNLITYDTVADMAAAANPATFFKSAYCRGYASAGDGGGGWFVATNTVTSTNLGSRIYATKGGGTFSWEAVFDNNIVNVERFGAGVVGTDSTVALGNAISAAGTNRKITFTAGKIFTISGTLTPLAGQHWIGKGATLKRCNQVTTTTATAILANGSPVTITVASTNGFFVGMYVTVFNGATFDQDPHPIVSMTSTTMTLTGFTTAFASGGTVVSAFHAISSSSAPARVIIEGFEIDGNKSNNTSLNKWQTHTEIDLTGAGTVVRDCYIHDCPSEGIEGGGSNTTYEHNRIIDLNGNGIHFSTADHVTVHHNYIKNANLTPSVTGHNEGGITWSALNGHIKLTDNYIESSLSGFGNFRSENARDVIMTGNTVTNCTFVVEGNMASPNTDGNLTIVGNQFFNSGKLVLNDTSSDPTDVYGHYNVTIANNLFENCKVDLVKAKGVTFSGNTMTNSTTTDVLVNIQDVKDFTGIGNLLIGGGIGFYVTSGHASNGTNNVNISIRGNTLRNQYTFGMAFAKSGVINGSATDNTIIAQSGSVNAAAWVGIVAGDGSHVSNNKIFSDAGLYGIQLGNGTSGYGGAQVFNNRVIANGSVITIKTFGGSSGNYIGGNLISSAISDGGSPNNFIGFNPMIGEPLRTGTGVAVGSTAPSVTNAVLITPTQASFVNANHTHQNAAGGGTLDTAALGSGTLAAARMPALTGDATTVAGNVAVTLAGVGTAGTYQNVTTDAKGRVTAGTNPTTTAVQAADQNSLDTTLVNATDLTIAVLANKTYRFRADLQFNCAAATAGVKVAITGPTSPTKVIGNIFLQATTTTVSQNTVGSFATLITASGLSTGLHYCSVWGQVVNAGNAGNITIQFAQNALDGANATTLKAASILTVEQLN